MTSEQSVNIALAGIEDVADILPLMVAFNEFEGIRWRPEPMTAALRRVLRDKEIGSVLVARASASRDLIGYCLATFGYDLEFAGRDSFITELFVDPASRGRGLGRALLEAMIGRLRGNGVNAVHLMVRPENERARALYESIGFNVTPRIMMTKPISK